MSPLCAVKIIEMLFDENGEIRSQGAATADDVSFDYWLSGFNKQQS